MSTKVRIDQLPAIGSHTLLVAGPVFDPKCDIAGRREERRERYKKGKVESKRGSFFFTLSLFYVLSLLL